MFSAHVHVFEDELLPQKQSLQGKSGKLQPSKGQYATGKQPTARAAKSVEGGAQAVKPKRRALANITNAHSKAGDSAIDGKADGKGSSAKPVMATALQRATGEAHMPDHLPSPEKLVGPTGKDMEEAAVAAEEKLIDEKVSLLLRALEGAWDDRSSDFSRDTMSDFDVQGDQDHCSPLSIDDLGPLPDCAFPPLFMDFIDH